MSLSDHLEIELKWALEESAHGQLATHLRALLGTPRELTQINRFFDTRDHRLRANGLNIRLRREDHGLLLTCKRRRPARSGAHCHDEWEAPLPIDLWQTLGQPGMEDRLPLPPAVREVLGTDGLVGLGGFVNQRQEFRHQQELLCLDRTDFSARVDHELEIETGDPARSQREWRQRLEAWGVACSDQGLSKFARFLALTNPV